MSRARANSAAANLGTFAPRLSRAEDEALPEHRARGGVDELREESRRREIDCGGGRELDSSRSVARRPAWLRAQRWFLGGAFGALAAWLALDRKAG